MSNNRLLSSSIKIKTEPGTSGFTMLDENIKIKLEPGQSSGRLTTLKLPRDLKLGGAKTKLIKPNLNVQRNKRTDPTSSSSSSSGQNARGKRGRGERGSRGNSSRGRPHANLVQSHGIFSDGIAENAIKKQFSDRLREDRDYDASKTMNKPTINKDIELKVDKKQEDLIMDDLLSISSENNEMDTGNDLHPINLPLNRPEPRIKLENYVKSEYDQIENGFSESRIFEKQDKLLLFQFPDTLPGVGTERDPETTSNSENLDAENGQTEPKCTLQDINEGLLGKIIIYKSGKSKFLIGKSKFDIELGPDSGFLQDVMSVPVNPETKSGDMINLGSVEGNVVISPAWDELLPK